MNSDRKFLALAAVIVGSIVAFRTDSKAGIVSGILLLAALVLVARHIRRG